MKYTKNLHTLHCFQIHNFPNRPTNRPYLASLNQITKIIGTTKPKTNTYSRLSHNSNKLKKLQYKNPSVSRES